eukprot:2057446-Rhodomonas_salina.3
MSRVSASKSVLQATLLQSRMTCRQRCSASANSRLAAMPDAGSRTSTFCTALPAVPASLRCSGPRRRSSST